MNRKMVNGLIVLAAIATGIAMSVKPWQVYREQKLAATSTTAEMREREAELKRLATDKVRLNSDMGKEELARNKGWVKKGEYPITINE